MIESCVDMQKRLETLFDGLESMCQIIFFPESLYAFREASTPFPGGRSAQRSALQPRPLHRTRSIRAHPRRQIGTTVTLFDRDRFAEQPMIPLHPLRLFYRQILLPKRPHPIVKNIFYECAVIIFHRSS